MPLKMQLILGRAPAKVLMSRSVAAVLTQGEGQLIGHVKACLFPSMHQAVVLSASSSLQFPHSSSTHTLTPLLSVSSSHNKSSQWVQAGLPEGRPTSAEENQCVPIQASILRYACDKVWQQWS